MPTAKIVGKCRSSLGAQVPTALWGDMDLKSTSSEAQTRRGAPRRRLGALALLAALAVSATVATDVRAQGWWPWANQQEPPRPPRDVRPPAPIPNQPPPPGGNVFPGGNAFPGQPPQAGRPGAPGASGGNICLQLEQRLVAEGQNRGVNPREAMAKLEQDLRTTERQLNQAQSQLDRGDCFEYFLFSKSLRNTPQCRTAQSNADQLRRRLSEIDQQRAGLASVGERRVTDDIVRELARNGCGPQYVQEARRLDNNQSNPFWATEEDNSPRGAGNQFGSLPFATYRTICVRLCDGYFFPVSFSTLPNHFARDADICQQKCSGGAPVELYYHQNPGANVDQAVSVKSNTNYTALKTAFRYRKEYVHGCSCKEAEYQPGAGERRVDAAVPGTPAARQPKQPPQ